MTKLDDGGPAFPTPRNEFGENSASMSLRDWFAGQALANDYAQSSTSCPDSTATWAYEIADAMLAARKKRPLR